MIKNTLFEKFVVKVTFFIYIHVIKHIKFLILGAHSTLNNFHGQ